MAKVQKRERARGMFGSLFGTVTTTAEAFSKVVESSVTGVDMIDAFVQKAKADQAERYAVERRDHKQLVLEEVSRERGQRRARLQEELQADPVFAQHYAEAYKELSSVFDEE